MIAFLFPGQGSQHVGMADDLLAKDPVFRDWLGLAASQVGCDLAQIVRRGPENLLNQTQVLQPLMVCVSLGYHRHLRDAGIHPQLVAGHSLGELPALAAAGVLAPEEAIHLAVRRGAAMQAAAAVTEGGMTAVTTDNPAAVLQSVKSLPGAEVGLANDNSPTQIVLSGERDTLEAAVESITLARLGTCRRLAVSGAWHSPRMEPARAEFESAAAAVSFRPPTVAWISNVSARVEPDPQVIRERLIQCIAAPVRWREVMSTCQGLGVTAFLEVGPGRVLCGLARANGFVAETTCLPVNNLRGVQTAARNVGAGGGAGSGGG